MGTFTSAEHNNANSYNAQTKRCGPGANLQDNEVLTLS